MKENEQNKQIWVSITLSASLDALNTTRIDLVREEKSKQESTLAKLQAEKERIAREYHKAEVAFLSSVDIYANAQKAIIRSFARKYAFEKTHKDTEVENFISWCDMNDKLSINNTGVVDTAARLQSCVESLYKDYLKGMQNKARKSKDERESELARKRELLQKLNSLSLADIERITMDM